MTPEELREAISNHPNIQALSRTSGVSAQCLYFIKRGARHNPKPSTIRMIERALQESIAPKQRTKYTPRTERLIDIVRTHGVVDTDKAAISSILEASEEINAAK